MALVRLQADKLNDLKQYLKSSRQKSAFDYTPIKAQPFTPPILPTPPLNTTLQQPKDPSFPIKRLSHAELKIRREKGLYYNRDDKYAPSQKCKSKFFLLVGEDGEPYSILSEEINIGEDTVDSSGISVPKVSMYALAGQINPITIRVKSRIGNHYENVVVNNRSTHNFIQERVAN